MTGLVDGAGKVGRHGHLLFKAAKAMGSGQARRGVPWFVLKAMGGWSTMQAAERYIHVAAAERSVLLAQQYDPMMEAV